MPKPAPDALIRGLSGAGGSESTAERAAGTGWGHIILHPWAQRRPWGAQPVPPLPQDWAAQQGLCLQLGQLSQPRWVTANNPRTEVCIQHQERQPVLLLPCSILLLAGLGGGSRSSPSSLSSTSGATTAHPAKGKMIFN